MISKSIGQLIDELSICNIKSFYFQEIVMNSNDVAKVADAAKKAQSINARRSRLIQDIDEYFKDQNTPTVKTYD